MLNTRKNHDNACGDYDERVFLFKMIYFSPKLNLKLNQLRKINLFSVKADLSNVLEWIYLYIETQL